jgi:sulfoacetaldehyde dehydrogenase
MPAANATAERTDVEAIVADLVDRARTAQREFESWTQEGVDDVVRGVAWACYKPENALALARIAVETTGLGRVEDKVAKNQRKTKGTLADLLAARTVGVIRDDPEAGIVEIAKPVGVVAAICPSTNPSATPTNKAMMALKGRNAIVIAPSPKGVRTCEALLELVYAELDKVGAPRGLVQALPEPVTKDLTRALMRACDLVVATGSQSNVRAAYSSGTPAIGVGSGNVPVIIDESADLADAAGKIKRSKVFDHATSCSSENAVVILDTVYDRAVAALEAEGGCMLTPDEAARLRDVMWIDGKLSREVVAQSPQRIAELAGLDDPRMLEAEFLMVAEDGVGPDHPPSGEKLSPVLTVYREADFESAVDRVQEILDFQGAGHSCGIHTSDPEHAEQLAHAVRVARVLVNQAHAFGNGGSFDNGLNFTLTMGCGTWAGNSISENLSYRHFLNITRLVRPIPPREPADEELWGPYFERYGE